MATLANAKLTQRRIVTGVSPALSFWTQESITLGIGSLAQPFKVLVAAGADTMTVATYAETQALDVNPLSCFSRGVTFTGVAQAGDQLEITNPPESWGGAPSTSIFRMVTAVNSDGHLVLSSPFWTRETQLTWSLTRLGAAVASGTLTGITLRELALGDGDFLDNQFQSLFVTPTEALNHLEYTTTMLDSLKAAILAASNEYTAAPNPTTSTFTV